MTEQQKRLRELVVQYEQGYIALNDEELLTLVLSPTGRQSKRIARIAKQIMNVCGLRGLARELVNAPVGLTRFGLSSQEVNRLKIIYDLVERCNLLGHMSKTQIRTAEDAERLFRVQMMHLDHEEMHVLVLDTKHQVIEYARPYKGTVNSTYVRAAEVFRPAVLRNSPAIIVCHNHPSGNAQSSPEDRETTRQLVKAGELLDIELLDHLIIGNPSSTSLRQELDW